MSAEVSHAKFSRGLLRYLQDGCVPVTFPDYSELPAKDLVNACNSFCSEMLEQISSHEEITSIKEETI